MSYIAQYNYIASYDFTLHSMILYWILQNNIMISQCVLWFNIESYNFILRNIKLKDAILLRRTQYKLLMRNISSYCTIRKTQ